MDKAVKKKLFRQKVLASLKTKRVNNYKKDKLLNTELLKYIKSSKIDSIMLFIPLKTEPNIAPLIKLLRECGYNLYVPFIEGKTFKLVKYRLPLKSKKFGIKEPNNSYRKVKKIDLAIVPLLGVDSTYRRVGFGKGMYDRFYSKFGKNIKTTIFLQRDIYFTNDTITDSYDISANYFFANSIKGVKFN
jgi:5-formyltetrahydrofolate cyclo-ligase